MGEIKIAVKGVLIKNNKMLIVKRSAFDETGAGTWEIAARFEARIS